MQGHIPMALVVKHRVGWKLPSLPHEYLNGKRRTKYLEDHNFIEANQPGFKKGKSHLTYQIP